jgi:transcriptional regulator with XRE-family HTH domain
VVVKLESLRDIRIRIGSRVEFIAKELGVSCCQYYKLEHGINKLDKLKIKRLAEIYRMSEDEIKNSAENSSRG